VVGTVAAVAAAFVGGSVVVSALGGPPGNVEDARSQDCTTITVVASSEKAKLVQDMAEDFNAEQTEGDCRFVDVNSYASGRAATAFADGWDERETGIEDPQVWIPTSSSWIGVVRLGRQDADRGGVLPDEFESVAQSPLVLAMPRPMAETLGWPDAQIGWETVLELAQDPQGWGSVGHPEWGPFSLGKTNPEVSTFGFEATVASYYAATGLSGDLTAADVRQDEVLDFVAGIEEATAHYGPLSRTFLTNLWKADAEGQAMGYVSAVPLAEKNVFDYNAGDPDGNPETEPNGVPRVPLVSVYPSDGTSVFDHPYLILDKADTTTAQRELATDFREYLQEPEQQQTFTDGGFRTFEGEVGEEMTQASGILAAQPTKQISMPPPAVLAEILESWDDVRKRARILVVVDTSGSMGAVVDGSGASRLELAQEAAAAALDELHPRDELAVWRFSGPGYDELVGLDQLDPAHNDVVVDALGRMIPGGGTPLYATVVDAVEQMRADLDTDRINAVVLLSDGANEHSFDDLDAVLDVLKVEDKRQVVRVFPIGYGRDADMATLERIAQASGGTAYDATDATSIEGIMISVLSNF
jgi:Ca-activated chloride channel family protein